MRHVCYIKLRDWSNAGFAGEEGVPKRLFADAVCRQHAQAGYDYSIFPNHVLSPHLCAKPLHLFISLTP